MVRGPEHYTTRPRVLPPRRVFHRRHRDATVERFGRQTRVRYQRLVNLAGPTGAALTLLSLLLDLARDHLGDVTVTQEQLAEAWDRRQQPRSPMAWLRRRAGWGTGVATVRRATRDLERDGWISLHDVPVPGGGGRHVVGYRFHVPDDVAIRAVWNVIIVHAEARRRKKVTGPRSQASTMDPRPAVPPSTGAEAEALADLAPIPARRSPSENAAALATRTLHVGGRRRAPP